MYTFMIGHYLINIKCNTTSNSIHINKYIYIHICYNIYVIHLH